MDVSFEGRFAGLGNEKSEKQFGVSGNVKFRSESRV